MLLRLILSDQLNASHSWFRKPEANVMYVMMETLEELERVPLHRQKQLGIIASMRSFAQNLIDRKFNVKYISLDDPENEQQINWNLIRIIQENSIHEFQYQEADVYQTHIMLEKLTSSLSIPAKSVSSEHFFSEKGELGSFFSGKKNFLMEHFYRYMRKKHNILMDENGNPAGGKWNFDAENRKTFPSMWPMPVPILFQHDLSDIDQILDHMNVKSVGKCDASNFIWPVSRIDALELLNYFINNLLPNFGTYQDAMTTKGWSLYHSRLSFALNHKIVSPKEVINAAMFAYERQNPVITLPQVEGYIRQVLGWREYMRGVYWSQMPEYASKNHLFANRKLPAFFWTGETEMACLHHVISQSLDYGWAHHIQRLMIPGNFAMLIGANPDLVDDWFLGVYNDAVEWVEMPNCRGMSQFADGGIVGTKPYAASANYINKMSDYCKNCIYDKDEKVGDKACPFNALYWHFYHRNRKRLSWYPRLNQIFATWDRMSDDKKNAYLKQADEFLHTLED